jgi:hypothetical protein
VKKFVGIFIVLLLILACGAPAGGPQETDVETIVAATLDSLTANAPTAVNGTTVAFDNLSIAIPPQIGSGMEAKSYEATPSSQGMPWWEVGPAYHQYLIQEYVWQNAFHKPVIYVYPADEYAQMNEDAANRITALKEIINEPSPFLPETLPFLPTFNAAQVFYAKPQALSFQNGSGIRYITQYGQGPLPINNSEVFYTFQGLTSDGKHYVSAVLPINHPLLVADATQNSITPEGGVPFEWNPDTFETMPEYLNAVTIILNTSDPNSFNPILPLLDQMIQSINVTLE